MHLITSSPLCIIPTCTRIKNVLHGIIHSSQQEEKRNALYHIQVQIPKQKMVQVMFLLFNNLKLSPYTTYSFDSSIIPWYVFFLFLAN